MARQLGAVRFIGRLANTVGYKARDGKGDAFDAVRNHTVEVANPQTLSQMSQRMKLTPVQNFFRGLQGLLDHSWQGVKYGNPSRLHFYSIAMSRLNTSGVPYVNKGDRKFVPWAFPISSGSLPVKITPVVGTSLQASNASMLGVAVGNIGEVTDGAQENSVAKVSAVLKSFIGVQNGQQFTLVWVYDNSGDYIPVYRRFVVNDSDETLMADLGLDCISAELTQGNYLAFAPYVGDNDWPAQNCVACGIIVSQLVSDVWQRNNASLVVADSLRTQYNSQSAFNAMLESYRSAKNTNSDWYLNEGDTDSGSTVSTIKEVTEEIAGLEATFAYYKIGATKYVPYFQQGEGIEATARSYRKESNYAFTKTGASSLGVMTAISDTTADFAAAGYTLITRTDLLAIAPELTIPA